MDHRMCIFFIYNTAHGQAGSPIGARTTPDIMPRRNRGVGACIIIEAGGVVDSGRFHDKIEVAGNAVQAVVEPPGRANFERRIMSGQGRQFARIRCFVQIEQNKGECGAAAAGSEQRP